MKNGSVVLLELEEQLRNDRDGRHRDQLLAQLGEHQAAIRARLDAGAPTDEFQSLAKLKEALEAAAGAVKQIWQSLRTDG